MNKLINELAQKAEDYADDTDLPWLATYTEKFADLLIQECVSTCTKLWYEENNKQRTIEQEDPRSIGLQVGVKGGILKCVNALSKLKNEEPN